MGSIGIVSLNQLGEIEDRFTAEQQFQLLRCCPRGGRPSRCRSGDPAIRWSVSSVRRSRIRGAIEVDTQRRLEDLPRSRHGTAPWGLVVPGSTRSLQLSVRCGLAQDRILRCEVPGDGGDEETRTPDPLLAKEMLCQLSYVPLPRAMWWAFLDSNQRPLPYQGSALTS
jgi:hypothetical protein